MPNKAFAFLPSDARLIPGHGVAMTREDVRWHIDYLQSGERRRAEGDRSRIRFGAYAQGNGERDGEISGVRSL